MPCWHLSVDAMKPVSSHKQQEELSETVVSLQGKIEKLEDDRRKAWDPVQPLKEAARIEKIDDLKSAIEQSDHLRVLRRDLAGALETLDQQGDGAGDGPS